MAAPLFTLNKIASDIKNPAAKRGDSIRVNINNIVIVDGFNVRIDDDELREHVASIAGAIAAKMPIPAIEVWVNPETGAIELVDGHCRYHAYQQYASENPDFDGYIAADKFEGTPFQRKMRIASSNKQLKLKPIELGSLYIDARDNLGATRKEIAEEAGMSLGHVDHMIRLAGGAPEVHQAIEAGEISPTDATKLIRDHGDDAPAELERRRELAKEAGKEKITAKVAPPKKAVPPTRPKVDMVVSNAVVLVKSLTESVLSICEQSSDSFVPVSSHALADLIQAVKDMTEGAKTAVDPAQMDLIDG